ncbi:hypothetical protein AVEN_184812-1 [Araneus ventricosus]|uniref:Uncharacterized protein n=1 Tax=Araneus ventricosus TaxID=182803 RepID=A0A4Y2QWF8_ARAVE|nr:hypothetical protein AVEN_184812-1 [Araneus ventricosus]
MSGPPLTAGNSYFQTQCATANYHVWFYHEGPPRRSLANGVQYHLSCNLWLLWKLQKDFRMKEDAHCRAYFDDNEFKTSVNVQNSIDDYIGTKKKPR